MSAIYSDVHFGNLLSQTFTETLSADFKRFGRLTLHDQLQVKSGHNYGFDWSREFGRSGVYVLGGLERQTSLQRAAMLAPVAALRLPLFRGQTLTMSYLSVGGSSLFRIEIGGPILRKREQVTTNSQTALIVLASLTGQVYFDADLDGNFKAGVDRPIPPTAGLAGRRSLHHHRLRGLFPFRRPHSRQPHPPRADRNPSRQSHLCPGGTARGRHAIPLQPTGLSSHSDR